MKPVFKDFNENLSQLRLAINSELCSLFRDSKEFLVDFENDVDVERLQIRDEDEYWRVTNVKYLPYGNMVVLSTESGNESDFPDLDTDDMVAVYESVYRKLVN